MERYFLTAVDHALKQKIINLGFPQMIDKLQPETGRLLGPQPVLFGK